MTETAKTNDIKPNTVYKVQGKYLVRTDSELEWSDGKVWVTAGYFSHGGSAAQSSAKPWRYWLEDPRLVAPADLTEVK